MVAYKLIVSDGRELEEDDIDLIVMQSLYNPRVKQMENAKYQVVRFDLHRLKYESKAFTSHDFKDPKMEAEQYLNRLERFDKTNPSKYSVSVKARDVFCRKSFFERNFRLFAKPVEYPEQYLPVPPRILGIWLEIGYSTNPTISNMDPIINQDFIDYCEGNGMTVVVTDKYLKAYTDNQLVKNASEEDVWNLIFDHVEDGMDVFTISQKYSVSESDVDKCLDLFRREGHYGVNKCFINKRASNPFLNRLKDLGVYDNKHIPEVYKRSSIQQRLQLLSGILDTGDSFIKTHFEISKREQYEPIINDIFDVAKSLGFNVMKFERQNLESKIWAVSICGDVHKIPVKVDKKKVKHVKTMFYNPSFEIVES